MTKADALCPTVSDLSTLHPQVSIAVGQAGNQVSTAFWENLLLEHGLDNSGVRVVHWTSKSRRSD